MADHHLLYEQICQAYERIKEFIRCTPLERSYPLTEGTSGQVFIKLESEQLTGAFKIRGAFNKCMLLKERAAASGQQVQVVTASTGNHAMACTIAMKTTQISGKIFVPNNASQAKLRMINLMGGSVHHYGDDCFETEKRARQEALDNNSIYISPYNDLEIVAGQGTIGVEILKQLPEVDVVMGCVGGGGMLGGISAYLKAAKPSIKIIGCSPANSAAMYHSIRAGKVIDIENKETLSDGSAGSIEEEAVTFEICRKYIDEWVLVTEEEIADAIYFMMEQHHKIIEGSAGVPIAAYCKMKERWIK
ncbi:uncharacterized protein TRIADDRAFT_60349 [Trichoplax adhaerens]|uniref:L-serine ammonia-lyase n=1 Tax=Trichoplax adhaerens TaxID=10228 RepID=B3S7Z2_TRIAD|nr:hypothetical protein TRIADDRAFT_60349 [Trichoplax adhaerens]EDV21099.1 hypothetical protein TRIADDRAFT_60349 [Trichoplax adhaerens]|eukprot:XP_002116429.1 hypothetical protein TRIADDRAFT_60349 [Trichoplax adhaerens]